MTDKETAIVRMCEYGPHEIEARWYVIDPSEFRVAVCDDHLVPALATWGTNNVSALPRPAPSRERTDSPVSGSATPVGGGLAWRTSDSGSTGEVPE